MWFHEGSAEYKWKSERLRLRGLAIRWAAHERQQHGAQRQKNRELQELAARRFLYTCVFQGKRSLLGETTHLAGKPGSTLRLWRRAAFQQTTCNE